MEGEISLANLGGGVAIEKFAEEMRRVVENILDPNTEATAKREILLRVALKPTSDRRMAAVAVALFEVVDNRWKHDAIAAVELCLGALLDKAGVKVPVFA